MSERKPPVSKAIRILVGVCSARQHVARRQAIRETWLSSKVEGIECLFFTGGGEPIPEEPDVMVLDSPDDYDHLPSKVIAFFRRALETREFDWLFKCDDDTYVCLDRLQDLPDGVHDFIGDVLLESRGSPQGGAGYLLSHERLRVLLSEDLPATGPEDILIGESVIRQGAKWLATDRLCWGHFRTPRKNNRLITSHYCGPDRILALHRALEGRNFREFLVDHIGWTDRLRIHADGFLNRVAGSCCGRWREEEGRLRLEWFDWPVEEVKAIGDGSYVGDRMTLRPALPFVQTVKRTPRSLCSAAFAYCRLELPFIAEWTDYHLSLGVDHIFLGLHINDEYQTPEAFLPAKRPFPSLYVLDGSEGDVVAEFLDQLRPFRNRLTFRLHRRTAFGLFTECQAQEEHYNRVLALHREDFEWIAVHDIDEFLVPTEHQSLAEALSIHGDDVAALRMRQIICEARWTDDRKPRQHPVLSLHRRHGATLPLPHGFKSISRMSLTRHLGLHGSSVYGTEACDDSILNYHFRGFPSATEIDTGYRLPVEREEFDTVDSRPFQLLIRAREIQRQTQVIS
jgi:hypothetical protein